MKYENFPEVTSIVKKIKERQEVLDVVLSQPLITIKKPYCQDKIEVDMYNISEKFYKETDQYLSTLSTRIESEIDELKLQLSKL